MKYNLKIVGFIAVLFIMACKVDNKNEGGKDKKQHDNYSAKIDSLIQSTDPRQFNGAILITQKGETKYSKTQGYSNFEEKTPVKLNDLFRIQSNSKQITAVLILRAVENGSIDLEETIKTYLPDFKQSWSDSVSVHQLLNMSSGIVALDQELIFKPGTDYKYSNPGYGVLGRIIEKVYNKKYYEIANALFIELGMNNTYCYQMGKANKGLVNGYNLENKEISLVEFDNDWFTQREWDDFIPAGGVISNVYDLNMWDSKLHNGEILKSNYYKLMSTPSNHGPHAAFNNDVVGYGYGLRISDKPSLHIGHGGRGMGFVCLKFYIPVKEISVIIWENIYCRDADVMLGDIVYHYENEIRKLVMNSSLVK